MAANTIGKVNVQLQANSDKLTGQLDKVRNYFKGWAVSITKDVQFIGEGLTGALVAGARMVSNAFMQQAAAIDATAKKARSLGFANSEVFGGLQQAAQYGGQTIEQFNASMTRYARTLSLAAAGNVEAQASFALLGITVEQITSSSSEEVFFRIADSIAAMENPAQRVIALTEIFGKSGADIAEMLSQGSEGLRAVIAESEALGITLNSIDSAGIESMNDAITKLKGAFNGITNTILAALAPIVTTIADIVTSVVQFLQPAFRGIGLVIKAIWTVIGPIFKAIGAVLKWLANLASGVVKFFSKIFGSKKESPKINPIDKDLPKDIANYRKELEKSNATMGMTQEQARLWEFEQRGASRRVLADLRRLVAEHERLRAITEAEAIDERVASEARSAALSREERERAELVRTLAGREAPGLIAARLENLGRSQRFRAEAELARDVGRTTDELSRQARTWGYSAEEVQLYDLRVRGATEAQLDHVRSLQETVARMRERDRLLEEGRSLTESMRSPQERFVAEMENIQRLYDEGVISVETYERASVRAFQNIAEANRQNEIQFPEAQIGGSREALTTILRAQFGQQDNSIQAQMQRVMVEQRELQRTQVQLAAETLRELRRRDRVEAV